MSGVLCVYEVVVAVSDDTPDRNDASCDHWTVYGVAVKPLEASDDEDHVQVGVVKLDGLAEVGVPGVVGAVPSK
jgi:hypothetical protein